MKVFVANFTNQVQDFAYRLPEQTSVRRTRIEMGGQVRLPEDLNPIDVEAIVKQHSRYGVVMVEEVNRTRPFVGLCISLDKPVPIETIQIGRRHNLDVLRQRGKEIRQAAAISINNAMEEQTPALQALEVSVIEEQRKDGVDAEFAEGIRVSRFEPPGETPPPAARREAARVGGRRKAA